MQTFLDVEMEILKATNADRVTMRGLISAKGAYLRQLAHLVINGSMGIQSASRLFLGY